MDTTQKIKAELEAYRASKQSTSPVGDTSNMSVSNSPKGDIKSELEAYRASKNAPETREGRIAQGLPVGTGDNVKPNFAGEVVRGIVKPFVKLGASVKAIGEVAQGKTPTGITSEFLGNVRPIGEGFDVTKGLTPENITAVKDSVGTGMDIASNIPIAKGVGIAKNLITQPFKKTALRTAKSLGKEGMVQGGLSGAGTSLQEDKGVAEVIGDTLKGTALGGAGGFVLGGAGAKASRLLSKTPADFTSELIDKDIRKAYQGVTGDVEELDKIAYGSKKGFELLANEAPNIKIPDSKAPIGSGATKAFDIKKANGNEFISAVNKLRQNVVTNARTAVKEASEKGFTLKTDDAKNVITQAVNNGDITPATASRLYKQIDNTKGDAEKIFNWVQDVNQKYKNRFEKGTIDDMATSRIANDIAEGFRKELNTITDRTGYAESMSNIKDLERLLVSVAKKANKNVNFGDITSEAGLDAGISLLTGNPIYMARTLGSGIFKGIVGKVKNTQGLRSVKSAIKGVSKIPNETKMPSLKLKQERLLLNAPKVGTPTKSINTPINVPSQKAINQGTEIVPRNKPTLNLLNKIKDTPNKQGGFATGIGYKETGNLTTKILKDLEGKTTVSKQYILDATNRGELKQVERDLIRDMVQNEGDEVNVADFAKKVKAELLPLKVNKARDMYSTARGGTGQRYESITLPYELRGNVKNYEERIYESPIKTSAGDVHFGQPKDKVEGYFGHTRIEDMADNKTRRVIEVQSDLYQKGRLEVEKGDITNLPKGVNRVGERLNKNELDNLTKLRQQDVQKLQQYNNPTAHFRMIREEIKKAAQDGKTKLQFPTGETAMKIEGFGESHTWLNADGRGFISPETLKVGKEIHQGGGDQWIITDVLGDGKFKAVLKKNIELEVANVYDLYQKYGDVYKMERVIKDPYFKDYSGAETFDISGKVDTNNPIYKFYEKDVQKYLNKFGGKKVVDDKGVSWIEIPITKEQGKMPVEAFGKIQLGTVGTGALLGTGALAGVGAVRSIAERNAIKYERPKENTPNKIDAKKLGNAIMQLESSGGTNKASADKGEKKWLMGLTEIAIQELKNQKLIDNTFDKNNEKDVIDAGVKYFNLMKKRNPKLSDAEVYVDKYWGGSKSKEQRQKKINEFNSLVK